MKQFLSINLVVLFVFQYGHGQTITPAVLNSTGGSSTEGFYTVDWSVGELTLVNTLKSHDGTFIITNGFFQPNALNKTPDNTNGSTFMPDEITLLPNPTYGNLEVQFHTKQQGALSIIVYDYAGRELCKKKAVSYGLGGTEKLDLSGQPKGTYLIRIVLTPAPGSVFKSITYKIVKI
jgi:hypothetical protein